MLPADLVRLRLTGTATDSQFAQNPIPVIQSMGHAMAELHAEPVDADLPSATPDEVAAALAHLDRGDPPPAPFTRVSPDTLRSMLATTPTLAGPSVRTHGSPIAALAKLTDSRTTFVDAGSWGRDPAERDLAIVLRSLAETFAAEATVAFLDAYIESGGTMPDGPTLDWYGLIAAFR